MEFVICLYFRAWQIRSYNILRHDKLFNFPKISESFWSLCHLPSSFHIHNRFRLCIYNLYTGVLHKNNKIDNDRYTVAMHQSSQIRHTSAFGTLEAFFQAMGPRFGLAICHDKKGTSWYNQQMSCWCNIITYYVILSIIINHDHSLVFIVIHYHSLLLVVIHYYWLSSTETINEKALNGNSSKFQTMKLQNPPMWQIQRV